VPYSVMMLVLTSVVSGTAVLPLVEPDRGAGMRLWTQVVIGPNPA